MSDPRNLTKRLRAWAKTDTVASEFAPDEHIAWQAANEIETLRERVRELENQVTEIPTTLRRYKIRAEAAESKVERLLMDRGRKDAQIAVYLSALAIEARQGRKEWAQDIVKRADAAALKVKRKDLVVAHTNSQQEQDDE